VGPADGNFSIMVSDCGDRFAHDDPCANRQCRPDSVRHGFFSRFFLCASTVGAGCIGAPVVLADYK
jgi:hypothetical protein